MISVRVVEFGDAGFAVGEIRNAPYGWLTVTKPLERGENLDWVELDQLLYRHDAVPQIS